HHARTARDESVEIPHSRPRRTSHWGDQTRLRLHEGALSRAAQEWPSARGRVRARGPVHDAGALAPPPGGGICPTTARGTLPAASRAVRGLPTGLGVAVHESLSPRWSRST